MLYNMAIRVIVWGTGRGYSKHKNHILRLQSENIISVEAVTSTDGWYSKKIDGWKFVAENEVNKVDVDIVLVTTTLFYEQIVQKALAHGFSRSEIFPADILDIANCSLLDYIKLYNARPTIISNNCWGGVTYSHLMLPFFSPFINMFISDEDYIRLCSNLKQYLEEKIVFSHEEYNKVEKFKYPCFHLGDITLHMNHYRDIETAEKKWYTRLSRVNYDNLFYMMYTESMETAQKFDSVRVSRKICFVSFYTDIPSAVPVSPYIEQYKNEKFWRIVLGMALGKYAFYDDVELLLNGNVKLRVE